MTTIYTAISFFFLAAMMGIYLLSLVLKGKSLPKALALFHGVFATTGLILLIFYIYHHGADLVLSLVLFVLAAIGGIILFSRDITGKLIPKWLAITHGTIAAIGFILLFIYALRQFPIA
ncbi:MAG TPA: hypothetical protein VI731_00410 [Bacteroidia bacterium]|nr:hypothetical protein [Bacteroidia bacterium]